jgi:hypothetical protein
MRTPKEIGKLLLILSTRNSQKVAAGGNVLSNYGFLSALRGTIANVAVRSFYRGLLPKKSKPQGFAKRTCWKQSIPESFFSKLSVPVDPFRESLDNGSPLLK